MSPIISRIASPGGAGGSSFLRKFRNRRFIIKPIMLGPGNGASEIVRKPTFIANAYSIVGSVGPHLSSDWQVSTNSTFTNIVQQSLNNTSNKTSFTLSSDLNFNTLYYARVRYTDGVYVSEWSDPISFTTAQFLDPLVNGTQTITTNGQLWTVPANVGSIRITLNGSRGRAGSVRLGNGGRVQATLSVTPGEVLRFDNFGGSWSCGPNSGSTLTQATLWMIVGSGGGCGQQDNGTTDPGNTWHIFGNYNSHGGGDTGNSGYIAYYQDERYTGYESIYDAGIASRAGTGGSQSSGGIATPNPTNQSCDAGNGGPLYGGTGWGSHYSKCWATKSGDGGSGWFGGAGGNGWEFRNYNFGDPGYWSAGGNKGWGAGGSSRIQLGERLISIEENSIGTSTIEAPLIEY